MAVVRASLFQQAYGQNGMNILHFHKPDFITAELGPLSIDIRDNWINNVRTVQTANLLYTKIKLHVVGSPAVPYEFLPAVTGSNSPQNEMVPYFCHMLQLRTATAGRSGRGRVYMWMVNPLLHFQGTLTPPFSALWATPINNIMARWGPSGTSDWRLVVNPHTEEDAPKQVVTINVAPVTAVQRRRNIGVGI